MPPPQLIDPCVDIGPVLYRRTPIAENLARLLGRAVARGNPKKLPHLRGQRIGGGVRIRRHREPKAPQVMVLIVVAVPAAVLLADVERQDRAARIRDGLGGRENSLSRLIAPSRTGVEVPSSLRISIDGKLDRAGDAALLALALEHGFQRPLGEIDISSGLSLDQQNVSIKLCLHQIRVGVSYLLLSQR